ncbi:MAG: DUF2786 domain-containing protein [Methylobacter tundripaludum]|nr:DUF2786 domain-containing protein [Methylobacter tundripaludum]
MTQDELKKIAIKIAKCLALASSDNPAEAEAAKRQADALMKKYNMTNGDVAAAQVHEQHSKTGSKHRPPVYLSRLGNIIATAFGCDVVMQIGGGWEDSLMLFMGVGIKPELAAYTFDVLRRQITKDRAAYSATLKRYKRENKIRMADIFCDAWIWRISQQVQAFAGTEQDKTAIVAYKEQRWGDSLKDDARKSPELKKDSDYQAIVAGTHAARDVSIHKPVQSKRGALLGQA